MKSFASKKPYDSLIFFYIRTCFSKHFLIKGCILKSRKIVALFVTHGLLYLGLTFVVNQISKKNKQKAANFHFRIPEFAGINEISSFIVLNFFLVKRLQEINILKLFSTFCTYWTFNQNLLFIITFVIHQYTYISS